MILATTYFRQEAGGGEKLSLMSISLSPPCPRSITSKAAEYMNTHPPWWILDNWIDCDSWISPRMSTNGGGRFWQTSLLRTIAPHYIHWGSLRGQCRDSQSERSRVLILNLPSWPPNKWLVKTILQIELRRQNRPHKLRALKYIGYNHVPVIFRIYTRCMRILRVRGWASAIVTRFIYNFVY